MSVDKFSWRHFIHATQSKTLLLKLDNRRTLRLQTPHANKTIDKLLSLMLRSEKSDQNTEKHINTHIKNEKNFVYICYLNNLFTYNYEDYVDY